jgi:nucleoid-associated protein
MINHIVLHEITKSKGVINAIFNASKCEVTNNHTAEVFVDEMHEAISKSSKKVYGVFSEAGISYFRQQFDEYISNKEIYDIQERSKEVFGSDNLSSLKSLLNSEVLATGGHVMMIDYVYQSINYFIVAMLNNKKGKALNINSQGIPELINTEQLDFSLLDLACRIDIKAYRETPDDKNYLCFIPGREIVSAYFVKFIGCEQFNQNKQNSKKLVEVIKALTKDKPNREELNANAFAYCETRRKNRDSIDVFQLAEYVFGSENKDIIYNYVQSNGISLDNSFLSTSSEIKRLISFVYVGDWLDNIKFERENIGTNIVFNSVDNTVVLKNVKGLIEELKNESN